MHKGKLRECVLLALQHEDEWVVRVGDREEAQQRVVVDDGKNMIRATQGEEKMKRLRTSVCSSILDLAMSTELLDGDDQDQGEDEPDDNSSSSTGHDSIMSDEGSDD
eukprot:1789584-Alexandrium_andersonii.AAC.2